MKTSGFSLMEVTLAILLVSVGLLSLFALFPLGLRESEMAIVDTHEAQFAEHVLTAMEGNAADITDWDMWQNDFVLKVTHGISLIGNDLSNTNVNGGVVFPADAADDDAATVRYIRYSLTIDPGAGKRTWLARLAVKSGKYGEFYDNNQVYITKFVYQGM